MPRWELDFDERRVIYQFPERMLRFSDVPSGAGATFRTAPAMDPKSWREGGSDGVGFRARCESRSGWAELFNVELTPTYNVAHRRFVDQTSSLAPCTSPTTTIELQTSCGSGRSCDGDWAGWGNPRVEHSAVAPSSPEQLLLLISIDTLRASRLGVYDADRDTSPQLERLAADGIVFEKAFSSAPWTIPSHATMLTSVAPRVHGANSATPVSIKVPLLAEILSSVGYETAGFVDAPFMSTRFGFSRGFDHFDDEPAPEGDFRRGAQVVRQRVMNWLTSSDRAGRSSFVFWHIMDVHGPYGAPAPFGGRYRKGLDREVDGPTIDKLRELTFHDHHKLERYRSLDDMIATYDEGIAEIDDTVGGLFDLLRQIGIYDEALIVVTSDHGESLYDHETWVGHGLFLTDEELHVPLLVKLPGNEFAGSRVSEMVGLVDVSPTILDVVDVAAPPSFEGLSLVSPEPGHPDSLPDTRFAYSNAIEAAALRTDRVKFISRAQLGTALIASRHLKPREGVVVDIDDRIDDRIAEQLYDLHADPGETTNLAREDPERLERLRAALEAESERATRAAAAGPPEIGKPIELNDEERERLRALGYVDSPR